MHNQRRLPSRQSGTDLIISGFFGLNFEIPKFRAISLFIFAALGEHIKQTYTYTYTYTSYTIE
jgi:hypothetical protein